jgi:hypothetical protein
MPPPFSGLNNKLSNKPALYNIELFIITVISISNPA